MPRVGPPLVAGGIAVAVAVGVMAAVLAGSGGVTHPFVSAAVVGGAAAAALSTAAIGAVIRRQAATPGMLVVVAAGAVAAYLTLMAGAGLALAGGLPAPVAPTVVRLAILGHVPVLTLFPLVGIAVLRALDPAGRPGRRWTGGVLLLSVGNAAVQVLLVPPWPPFDRFGAAVPAPGGLIAAAEMLNLGWLATMIVAPVLLAGRARALRGEPDDRSARMVVAAVAALVPVCLVVLCTMLGVATSAGGLGEDPGVVLLLLAMCVAWPLTAGAYALAVRPAGAVYAVGWGALTRAASLLLGLLTAMVAVVVTLVVGLRQGPAGAFWVATVALGVAALLRPLANRVRAALLGGFAPGTGGPADQEPEAVPDPSGSAITTPADVPVANGQGPAAGPVDRLSPREREVLHLLAQGRSNAGIAAEMVLSQRTVEAHLRSIFTKLDLSASGHDNRRVQAVLRWHAAVGTTG